MSFDASPPRTFARPAALVLAGGTVIVALLLFAVWAVGLVPMRGSTAHFNAVRSLETVAWPPGGTIIVAVFGALLLATLIRRPQLASPRAAMAAVGVALISMWAPFSSHVGHHAVLTCAAAVLAVLLTAWLPSTAGDPKHEADGSPSRSEWTPWFLWLFVSAVAATYSMHRHWAFGSGSWDHGCMVHNFYRASRFLDSISTVLGGVDFLGDHFMIGIYLYAPIMWIDSSGYTVLLIQSINLAATAPAIYLIARHRGAGQLASTVLALVTSLSFGLQSAAYFDSHEITVGFGFLAFGIWAFDTRRFWLATLLLFTFALFKESLGAYVAALGLLAVWRGVRDRDARSAAFGFGWVIWGAVWFVLVNRVFMPALIARGLPPEPHETFADFGPTVFEAARGIVTHPMKALAALFVPPEKLASHAVTLGGVGWLALLSPELLIAALPLLAERFLSSKSTMWEMGYHYAAPLSFYAGWAAARAWPQARAIAIRALNGLHEGHGVRGPAALGVYLAISALLVTGFAYKHPANFYRWRETYFSTPERRDANAEAVAFVQAQGRDAKIAVQNRILSHLADRPYVYRLGDWAKADWVVLSVGESAWPWDDALPQRTARLLHRDPAWTLVFSQGGTAVFAKKSVTALPAVAPNAELKLPPPPRIQVPFVGPPAPPPEVAP